MDYKTIKGGVFGKTEDRSPKQGWSHRFGRSGRDREEYDRTGIRNDIIIIDGLAFPEDDMLGIDLVIPDITYLAKEREKSEASCWPTVTKDHIGALPVLKQLKVPVFGTLLTLGLFGNKPESIKCWIRPHYTPLCPAKKSKLGKWWMNWWNSSTQTIHRRLCGIGNPDSCGYGYPCWDFKVDYTLTGISSTCSVLRNWAVRAYCSHERQHQRGNVKAHVWKECR